MKLCFGNRSSRIGLFFIISHCPIFVFSICEARPFSLYLMLVIILIYYLLTYQNKISQKITISALAFAIPSTFYIGGIYTLILAISYVAYRKKFNLEYKSVVLCFLCGWFAFVILIMPTFASQVGQTFTKTFSAGHSLHLNDLFEQYGTQAYLPISLLFLIFLNQNKNKISMHKEVVLIMII